MITIGKRDWNKYPKMEEVLENRTIFYNDDYKKEDCKILIIGNKFEWLVHPDLISYFSSFIKNLLTYDSDKKDILKIKIPLDLNPDDNIPILLNYIYSEFVEIKNSDFLDFYKLVLFLDCPQISRQCDLSQIINSENVFEILTMDLEESKDLTNLKKKCIEYISFYFENLFSKEREKNIYLNNLDIYHIILLLKVNHQVKSLECLKIKLRILFEWLHSRELFLKIIKNIKSIDFCDLKKYYDQYEHILDKMLKHFYSDINPDYDEGYKIISHIEKNFIKILNNINCNEEESLKKLEWFKSLFLKKISNKISFSYKNKNLEYLIKDSSTLKLIKDLHRIDLGFNESNESYNESDDNNKLKTVSRCCFSFKINYQNYSVIEGVFQLKEKKSIKELYYWFFESEEFEIPEFNNLLKFNKDELSSQITINNKWKLSFTIINSTTINIRIKYCGMNDKDFYILRNSYSGKCKVIYYFNWNISIINKASENKINFLSESTHFNLLNKGFNNEGQEYYYTISSKNNELQEFIERCPSGNFNLFNFQVKITNIKPSEDNFKPKQLFSNRFYCH